MSKWTVDIKGEVSVFYDVTAESEGDAVDAATVLFLNDMETLGAIVEEDTVSAEKVKKSSARE